MYGAVSSDSDRNDDVLRIPFKLKNMATAFCMMCGCAFLFSSIFTYLQIVCRIYLSKVTIPEMIPETIPEKEVCMELKLTGIRKVP